MSVFQLFWNLILGISGGIISGIIVSRIFLIQGDFQNQINSFDLLLRKLGYTSGMLFGIRTVQEFSYDSDIKMHNEMKKEGISTEEEYYKAHIDVNWISKDRLVSDLLKECKKMNTSLKDELMDLHINEFWFTKAANFRQVSHKFSFPIQYRETSHSPSPPVESSYAQISPSQYTAFGQW